MEEGDWAQTQVATLSSGTPVGAWMLKARPDIWDIGSAIEQRLDLDWWRLADTYRADLVDVGHPCALWITRGDNRVPSGIWALGQVTGEVHVDSGDPDDPLWVDRVAQKQLRPRVPVHLRVLSQPLTREQIAADPRLSGLEILRVPRIGNPAAIRPDEWETILDLVDAAELEA